MKKKVILVELKGTDYKVGNETWGTYIPESELKDIKENPNANLQKIQ